MIIGIGTRRGVTSKEVIYAVNKALRQINAELSSVSMLASAKMKENEAGLLEAAQLLDIEIKFLPHDVLNKFDTPSPSQAKRFGLTGVAEPAALALSNNKELILKKKVYGRITIAIAK
ncbi:MAG: cobalamin biosynthesis protein [Methanosarcinaceae archaeon]|nr:cobalamin biosynthesis protein [Methanosarcinaceae archaeon]MDF1534362.1 cobalamin biosynthesis protein [Methanosarcinaceae archaeon]